MTTDLLPTRAGGLALLAAFVPRAGYAYQRGRNTAPPPGEATASSRLSPYLQRRMILETEVLRAVLAAHSPTAAEKFIQEILWRTYWKGWLEQRPVVWRAFRQALAELAKPGAAPPPGLLQAENGKTGIDCFDQWVNELRETGYLHNHARMWFASIWTFTLRLPWQLGAAFFHRQLLDADAASNTLSWRWVAGLQTKGKIYLARASNIAQYTEGRFAETPQLVKDAAALPWDGLAELPLEPLLLGPAFLASAAPAGRTGLLLHPEDLFVEGSELSHWPVSAIGVLDTWSLEPGFQPEARVAAWSSAALREAAERAARHYGAPVEFLSDRPQGTSLASTVQTFCSAHRFESLVTIAPMTGPWKDCLEELPQGLLVKVRRGHDLALFPRARRGFFDFGRQIPNYLKTL